MKKDVLILFVLVFSLTIISAEACDLSATLLNQDPYPAVPGDYIKLVFQLTGLDTPDCGDITFELLPDYPIEFNPGETGKRKFNKVDYLKDYESNLLIPYKVRINEDALNGANPVEVKIQNAGDAPIIKSFDIEINDIKANFEVYIKNYNYKTHELTLEVLNIAEADVEALTLEIPKQDSIIVKGANRIVVGDLDSNEYTTADFEAILSDGEFKINLIYSDAINIRRATEKSVMFDSSYFTERIADQKTTGTITYIFLGVIIFLVIYFGYRKIKRKKKK